MLHISTAEYMIIFCLPLMLQAYKFKVTNILLHLPHTKECLFNNRFITIMNKYPNVGMHRTIPCKPIYHHMPLRIVVHNKVPTSL